MAVVVGTKKVVLARSIFRYSIITMICLMVLFPLYWMIVTAIQPPDITLMYPPVLYPQDPNLDGFRELFRDNPMAKWLINSGFVALLATLITTSFSVLGAYAISWFQWKGKTAFGWEFGSCDPLLNQYQVKLLKQLKLMVAITWLFYEK